MIGDAFGAVDAAAHFLGWAVIVFATIWIVTRGLEDRRANKEWSDDLDAERKFELYLKDSNPDQYRRYLDVRHNHVMEKEELHWHRIAMEVGVPIIEITKKR